jgi:excisionase family DNA binding protein
MSDCINCNPGLPNRQGEPSGRELGSQLAQVEVQDSEVADGRAIRPAWVSYRDAEIYCSLSRVTLWRLINEGEIKAARCGRAVRISVDSLDAYLSRQASDDLS